MARQRTKSRPGNPSWRKGVSANPGGKSAAELKQDALRRDHNAWLRQAMRGDGWTNVITGHGVASRDKRLGARFYADPISDEDARQIWRGDPLAARIVEALPDEMLREAFHVCIPDDGNDEEYGAELVGRIEQKWHDLSLVDVLHEALCYERALGGAAIVLGADDGALSMTDPLNVERVRSLEWLTVLEPRECLPIAWYTDPRAPKFGRPEIYQLNPITTGAAKPGTIIQTGSMSIHESRLITFQGTRVSRSNQVGTYNGWGDSIFTRVFRVLADFNSAWSGAGVLVSDFAVPVFQMEGLAEMVAQDNTQLFHARMQALAMAMSTVRAALIDKNESYERKQTPVTGLPELLDLFCKMLAAVADTPVSVLWGEAPGGINASGAQGDQLQIWRNRIRAKQTRRLGPPIRYLSEIIMATMGGAPDKWWIDFDPLHSPSAKEQADTNQVVANTATQLIDRQVLTPEEVRRAPGFAKQWGIVADSVPETAEPTAGDVTEMLGEGAPGAPEAPPLDVDGVLKVVDAVTAGKVTREAGLVMLERGYLLAPADAAKMLPAPSSPPAATEIPVLAQPVAEPENTPATPAA